MPLLDTLSEGIMVALSKGATFLRDAPPLPEGMIGYSRTGMPAPTKSREGLEQYRRNPWAYSGTNAIVNTFAMTELFVRKKMFVEGEVEYEIRREHQSLDLLENHMPNTGETRGAAYLTKTMLKQLAGIHLIGAGEAFWVVGGRVGGFTGFAGIPTELHPLVPEFVDIKFDERTNYIKQYNYKVNGRHFVFDPQEIVHFKQIDPLNPYRGLSSYLPAGRNFDTDAESSEYIYHWFLNKAQPETVVMQEDAPSDEEMERLRAAWADRFAGARNAGAVHFLSGKGVDIKDMSKSQRDMQFKELKEFNRDTILADLRVGKGILGMMEDQSRANAETQEYVFGKHIVKPFMVAFCEQLTRDYLPLFGNEEGEEFWFDEESIVPEDKIQQAEVCSKLWPTGAISSNDIRSKFGMDMREEPEADALWYPIGMRSTIDEPFDNDGLFGDENEEPEEEEDRMDVPNLHLRKSDPIKITKVIDIFDDQREISTFATNGEKYFGQGMVAGIELGMEQVGGSDFSIDDIFDTPHARAVLRRFSLDHAVNTLNTTKKDLQKLIDLALEQGRSNQELATAISRKYGTQYKGYRARRIARTEITGVVNAGTNEVYRSEGIEKKVWIVTQDGRQRATHQDVHDHTHKSPVDVDGYFDVGSSRALYPGDPSLPPEERVNCVIGAETPILTKNGMKMIGSIKVGDEVMTHMGNWRKVERLLWDETHMGSVIEIVCSNGAKCVLTPEHKVWTGSEWKRADLLLAGDMVAVASPSVPKGDLLRDPFLILLDLIPFGKRRSSVYLRKLQDEIGKIGLRSEVGAHLDQCFSRLIAGDLVSVYDTPSLPRMLVGGIDDADSKDAFDFLNHLSVRVRDDKHGSPPDVPILRSLLSEGYRSLSVYDSGKICKVSGVSHDNIVHTTVAQCNVVNADGEKLWNFAVEGDESYTAGCIAVSNCRCTTVSADFLDVMQDNYVQLFLRQHGSLERDFTRSLARLFEGQKKRVLSRIA